MVLDGFRLSVVDEFLLGGVCARESGPFEDFCHVHRPPKSVPLLLSGGEVGAHETQKRFLEPQTNRY